jgi:stage II sporulation protein D
MRRFALLTALLALAAAPAAADAATVNVIRGGGWGHGIGMSQYGAYGYAQNGTGYRDILAHYYQGTRLTQASGAPVRVLLQPVDPYIRIRGASRAGSKTLKPSTTYVARRSGSTIVLRNSRGRLAGRFGSPLRLDRPGHPLRLMGPAINGISGGLYRGAIEVTTALGGVSAINVLGLDPYVQGVVPGEMPSTWHPEALKTQAVAARSYALATDKPGPFDQYPDTRSQVYRGLTGERASTNAAVSATAGQILTYKGAPAVTYFFSTSGGHTENIENVFIGYPPKAYLRGVDDPYDGGSPYHRWSVRLSNASMDARLGSYSPGRFKKIKVLQRGSSPRIVRARVYGSSGTRIITGPTIRARLGLRDTWALFSSVSSSQVKPPSPRATRWGGRQAHLAGVWPLTLAGRFKPAPRGGVLLLERRTRKGWRRAGKVRTTGAGSYSTHLARAGVYRVRKGAVAGSATRIR